MLTELKLPEAGMGITEGTIAKWHKAVAEEVRASEIIVDVETAKAITEVQSPIDGITKLHQEHKAAQSPATWLFCPVSEKVDRAPAGQPSMLTLAFANGEPGLESEFREWYATRHIRHALKIPALVSGQCFERTQFQKPGILEAKFNIIAVYEQVGTSEDIIRSFATLPKDALSFPMLDRTRFAESVYRPL